MERGHRGRQRRHALGELARLSGCSQSSARARRYAVPGRRPRRCSMASSSSTMPRGLALREPDLERPELGVGERALHRRFARGQRGLEAREDSARRRAPVGARAQPLDDLLAARARARPGPRRSPGPRRAQRRHAARGSLSSVTRRKVRSPGRRSAVSSAVCKRDGLVVRALGEQAARWIACMQGRDSRADRGRPRAPEGRARRPGKRRCPGRAAAPRRTLPRRVGRRCTARPAPRA